MNYVKFFLLFLSTTALAQVRLPTNDAGQVQYQEIVRIGDGKLPARQVFEEVRAWAEQHYPSANEAERHFDQQHGILFVRSVFPVGDQSVRYTLTVEARIGRYRATITDLVDESDALLLPLRPTSSTAEEINRTAGSTAKDRAIVEQIVQKQADFYKQLNETCRATLASLKKEMTSNGE